MKGWKDSYMEQSVKQQRRTQKGEGQTKKIALKIKEFLEYQLEENLRMSDVIQDLDLA